MSSAKMTAMKDFAKCGLCILCAIALAEQDGAKAEIKRHLEKRKLRGKATLASEIGSYPVLSSAESSWEAQPMTMQEGRHSLESTCGGLEGNSRPSRAVAG